ncbi:hypothetical protein [Portibacter marinus]|uniref:hypothetical protein n=1 Tax=Portibacter marinus TaxID=2898660 RepID=UPI001F21B701|nr:hypothetical protein [Portibacter marinus]
MKYILIFLHLVMLVGCESEEVQQDFWEVGDVTKSEDRIALLLDQEPDILNIYVKGETDGDFQIIANGRGDNEIFHFQGGEVDTVVSRHWKSPICKTIYVPKTISSGKVSISTLIYPKK